ncbi:uncharacterized protein LOC111272254 isoform X2 [Varroa jacobsoni]|uniref:Peptidase S54 rhomboid domain-containing protein n=1 Tax=Varroa destructor TaxID=109461 RepID=A0A7M7JSB6_VARDE|nr:uncharacterized protein LOC111248406 isoform X2 [Varroa destructor]XP_022709315.1 uncharacterized protein LOC111272254 isoform X2 [Varroa jacobsoni]
MSVPDVVGGVDQANNKVEQTPEKDAGGDAAGKEGVPQTPSHFPQPSNATPPPGIPPNVTYIEPLANLDLTATLARRRRVHYADPPAASSHSQCTAAIRDALSAPKQDLPSSAASDITPLTSSRDHRERRDSSATTVGVEQNGGDCSGQTPQSPYISASVVDIASHFAAQSGSGGRPPINASLPSIPNYFPPPQVPQMPQIPQAPPQVGPLSTQVGSQMGIASGNSMPPPASQQQQNAASSHDLLNQDPNQSAATHFQVGAHLHQLSMSGMGLTPGYLGVAGARADLAALDPSAVGGYGGASSTGGCWACPPELAGVGRSAGSATPSCVQTTLATIPSLEELDHFELETRKALLNDWRQLFDKFDPEGFGEIPWDDFLRALDTPEFEESIDCTKRELFRLKAQDRRTNAITFDEFIAVMTRKRTRSLEMAVHQRDSCGSLWMQSQQQAPTLQMEVMHGPVNMATLSAMGGHLQNMQALQSVGGIQTLPHSLGRQMGTMSQLAAAHPGGLVSHVCTGGAHSQQGTPSHHVCAHVHQSNESMYIENGCIEQRASSGFNGNPYLAASVAATALASSGDTTQNSSGLDECIVQDDIPVISVRRADTLFSKMVNLIGGEFLPEDRDRKYYADSYTCCPPPLFILFVTICQIALFTYYSLTVGPAGLSTPIPAQSIFIFNPGYKFEIWRYFSYFLVHNGWLHLGFNIVIQLFVGLPLEMLHGSWRIGFVYIAAVIAGSVFCSVVDPTAFLVGASCPVYALLSAHLANILLNHDALSEFGLSKFFLRITLVFLLSSIDFGFALFDRVSEPDGLILAFLGPFVGVAFGVSVGCVVVRSYERKLREQLACWLVIIFYVLAICGAIVYNVLNFDAFRQASAALF